jgi:hypothetical protein
MSAAAASAALAVAFSVAVGGAAVSAAASPASPAGAACSQLAAAVVLLAGTAAAKACAAHTAVLLQEGWGVSNTAELQTALLLLLLRLMMAARQQTHWQGVELLLLSVQVLLVTVLGLTVAVRAPFAAAIGLLLASETGCCLATAASAPAKPMGLAVLLETKAGTALHARVQQRTQGKRETQKQLCLTADSCVGRKQPQEPIKKEAFAVLCLTAGRKRARAVTSFYALVRERS